MAFLPVIFAVVVLSSPGMGDVNIPVSNDPNVLQKWVEAQADIAAAEANKPAPASAPVSAPNDANAAPKKPAAPEVKNLKTPEPSGKRSALAVHALCADFLASYVNDQGLVDYKNLRRKRLDLISVLSEYSRIEPNEYSGWSKQDQLAYWINVYNLCVIKEIVDNYPIQSSSYRMLFYPPNSIMQISGAWDKAQFSVMGENYTLTEMEQKIIRRFGEPRVCLAINYASIGSAPLRQEPYLGKTLSAQLEDQARRLVAKSDVGFRIDRDEPALYLSALFEWYGPEFAEVYPARSQFSDKPAAQAAVLAYLSKLVTAKDADWLARKIYPVKFMRFNWTLNEQR